MRKFLLAGVSLFISCYGVFGQNKTLGVGVATPNLNAALHVESPSSNQGFIMPRLTTVQRDAMRLSLTGSDKGLMLFDTDLNTLYIWNGAGWNTSSQVAGGPRLLYPYVDTVKTSPGVNANLLRLVYSGTAVENVGVAHFENLNANSGFSAIFGRTNSATNGVADFIVNNPANNNDGINVSTNGLGTAGRFNASNKASKTPALWVETNSDSILSAAIYGLNTGTGDAAGVFRVNNTLSTASALFAETNGSGPAAFANQIGLGRGGQFQITNASNTNAALRSFTSGTGYSGYFSIANPGNTSAGIFSTTDGKGAAVYGQNTGVGDGFAGLFSVTQASNTFPAVQASTAGSGSGVRVFQDTGTGPGIDVFVRNTGTTAAGLIVDHQGLGNGGNFNVNNISNAASALQANTNGTGYAINARHTGTSGDVIYAEHAGLASASAGNFRISNAKSSASALFAATNAVSGTAMGASNDADGIAFAVWRGGVQITVLDVTTSVIPTRASAFRITAGVTPFSLGFTPTVGEVFMIYNETAAAIDFVAGGITHNILNGQGKTFVVFPGGAVRGF